MTSKVLYMEQLPSHWTEGKLRTALEAFGEVRKIVLLRKRNAIYAGYNPTTLEPIRTNTIQALIEAVDIDGAAAILDQLEKTPLVVDGGRIVTASYSKNQELRERHTVNGGSGSRHHGVGESNRILLVTVQNPTYPITTDLMHSVFHTYGVVEKIVIFVKPVGLQCLVQFVTEEEAVVAKHALNGLSVFPDCCGLVIHFSNLPQELIVKENGLRTKDFTNSTLPTLVNDTAVNSGNDIPQTVMYGYPSPAAAAASMVMGHHGMIPPPIVPGVGREVISPVLLVCNLREFVTCDHLFNLFSCYGNVARVKKLAAKSDHALIQFSNQLAAQSALIHLRGFTLLGRSLEISYSKHSYIAIRPAAPNGTITPEEASLMKEYGHGVNRFTGKYANGTKHIYSPTKIVHVSNLDEAISAEQLREHLSNFPGGEHCKVKLFANSNGHTQALAEFSSVDAATNVLAEAHNAPLGARRLKLAFSRKTLHS